MKKLVRYNGDTEAYYPCTDPKDLLIKGNIYEVVDVLVFGFHTKYILEGINGEFNSIWFDEVKSDPKVYMAIAYNLPVIGQPYTCCKINASGDQKLNVTAQSTSKVKSFYYLGNNIYEVITQNSKYIVTVSL